METILLVLIPILIALFVLDLVIHYSAKNTSMEIINSSGHSASEIISVIRGHKRQSLNLTDISNRNLNSPTIYSVIISLQTALGMNGGVTKQILSWLQILGSLIGYGLIAAALIGNQPQILMYGLVAFYMAVGFLVINILLLIAEADEIVDLLRKSRIIDSSDIGYYRSYLYSESFSAGKNLFIILYYFVIFLNPFPAISLIQKRQD